MPNQTPTQDFLQIKEIRDGTLVLKNNTLRGVIITSSLNFALKSGEEQDAIIYQFQDFINSLDFSLEIAVQSRRLNITGYLEKLKELENKKTNDLLKAQTEGYRNFIKDLISKSSIMSKKFFVIVPFVPFSVESKKKGGLLKKPSLPTLTEERFKRGRDQLMQRMEFIALGLQRCNLQCSILGSEELIELMWSLHHPEQSEYGYYPEIPPEIIK
jgi:hypothetical protein